MFALVSCLILWTVDMEVPVKGSSENEARLPAVSGRFYPANPAELRKIVDQALETATPPNVNGDIVALMVPHAGYVFSGGVCAAGYKLLQGRAYDTVILMGSAHRVGFQGVALDDSPSYRTPLGDVPVDRDLVQRIAALHPAIHAAPRAHAQDHVLETQLPFLQTVLSNFSIVPLLFGIEAGGADQALADGLPRLLAGRRWLIIASTDLSHYPPYAQAREVDLKTVDAVLTLDPATLRRHLAKFETTTIPNLQTVMCGSAAVLTVLDIARTLPSPRATTCLYANSGDVPLGDKSGVVGYAAIAFTANLEGAKQTNPAVTAAPSPLPQPASSPNAPLTADEKRWLLDLARRTLNRLSRPQPQEIGEIPEALRQKRGAFVTLKKAGELRGCIGFIEARAPLFDTVIENTLNAALKDYRFPTVTSDETADLTIEISALTPLREIPDHTHFVTGQHGIIMRRGSRSAVFLPQVAPEQGWDRETTLKYLSLKAGLPPDAWTTGCTFFVFEAEVFHENE